MNTDKEHPKVWKVLEVLKNDTITEQSTNGLCWYVGMSPAKIHSVWNRYSPDAFRDWGLFSGVLNFPIPSSHKGFSPLSIFLDTADKWDKKTEYGKNRWALLDHCIRWFKERDL